MNRLKKMLLDLCPDGVKHLKLKEIAKVERGIRVVKSELSQEGKIPVYQNSMTPLGYHEKSNCKAYTAFVIGAGAAGEIGFSDVDFWAADDCYYCSCPQELNDKFLYYTLMCQQAFIKSQVRKASIPRLSRSIIENLIIPLPPLEIQAEIVKILDDFTEKTKQLQEQLTAELIARQKQYEYYRDLLLDFGTVHGGGDK